MVIGDILWLDSVASTNDEAWARVHDHGICAVGAREQSAGRGRAGRSWESPANAGLYLSWICRPALGQAQGTLIPLAIAVGAAEVCESLGCAVALKWPNDILFNGQKLAGILCEARTIEKQWIVVVGIGMNLRRPIGGWSSAPNGISLADLGQSNVDKAELATSLVGAFQRQIGRLERGDCGSVLKHWQARGPNLGTPMSHSGHAGTYAGLTSTGALRLKIDDRVKIIHGGDVHLIGEGDESLC